MFESDLSQFESRCLGHTNGYTSRATTAQTTSQQAIISGYTLPR